jgi:hypothetical protein
MINSSRESSIKERRKGVAASHTKAALRIYDFASLPRRVWVSLVNIGGVRQIEDELH